MEYCIIADHQPIQHAVCNTGTLVYLWRRQLGVTQEELSKRTGLMQSYISGIERGSIDPRLSTLVKVSSGLGNLSLDTFFRGPNLL